MSITIAEPSAIGCCAEAKTRRRPPREGMTGRFGDVEVQEGNGCLEVVEDVVAGPCFDDREERDDGAAAREDARQEVDVLEAPDDADDQVDDDEEPRRRGAAR